MRQDPDWARRLKNFDEVFPPSASAVPTVQPQDGEKDLGAETPRKAETVEACPTPDSMTLEQFNEKHPQPQATMTLNMDVNVTCYVVDGSQVFITTASTAKLAGVQAGSPKPIFLYAGGTWISDNAKAFIMFVAHLFCGQAKDFLTKEVNQNKAVEYRLEDASQMASRWRC